MDKEERLKRSRVFSKIAEVRKDAISAKKFAETNGGVGDYNFWEGYLEGVDYVIFLLQELKFQKNQPKPKKTTRKVKGK